MQKVIGRGARGQSIAYLIEKLKPIMRGWYNYYSLAETAWSFGDLDGYVRRRIRWLYWRHWKTPRTRRKRLIALGLRPEQARKTAYSGCGPWRCSRIPGVHQALPNSHFDKLGLFSLLQAHQKGRTMAQPPSDLPRTAVYGSVRTVVWEDRVRKGPVLPDKEKPPKLWMRPKK